jgi:hypothetical protein
MSTRMQTIEGVLEFWSETGTEGGHWAIYDPSVDKIGEVRYGLWPGNDVLDANDTERKGEIIGDAEIFKWGEWRPLPDPMREDPDYVKSTLFQGVNRGDREADLRLAEKYGFTLDYPEDRDYGVPRTDPMRPYGAGMDDDCRALVRWEDGTEEIRDKASLRQWHGSYEGLHMVEDGDHLQVRHPESGEIHFEGEISLRKIKLFTEDANGMWMNTGPQEGWDGHEWGLMFQARYPATLTKKEVS